jgi:hypothetical protein
VTMADNPDREPGPCPRCNELTELVEPQFGCRYWTCPNRHDPPVVVRGPEQWGYAWGLVAMRITSGSSCDASGVGQFTTGQPGAPARFIERICERLQLTRESTIEDERDRRAAESGRDETEATSGAQAGLGRFA